MMGTRILLVCALLVTSAAAGVEQDFDYFVNNWNVVGLPDYFHGSRITPNNEMCLAAGTAIRIRAGRSLTPMSRANPKRAMKGWMPIIEVSAADGPVKYQVTYWATPLPDAQDWQKAFAWPTEGENYLNWISVKATNTGADVMEAKADLRPDPAAYADRRAAIQNPKKHTREYSWAWKLRPGQSAEGVARYTFFPIADPRRYDAANHTVWLQRTIDFWQGIMDRAARIQTPCRKATEALLASHVCQLIASDLGELHGGEGFYDEFYVRDGAYQLQELEEAGLSEAAARAVDLFLRRQRPDGRFESQQNQYDANGQAIWALWNYAKMTGDRAFLDRVHLRMLRAVAWTMRERRKAPADSPFAGLLTVAPADGESLWDGKHHIVGYDLWNLRGLLCTADAARLLGRSEDEEELLAEAQQYRAAIDAAWKRTGLAYFPPSWEKEGTHWGNTETLWPTRLFEPNDPRATASINHVRKEFTGGFIEGTIQWRGGHHQDDAIHPYMGAYTVMASLIRGEDETVVQDFYWYLLHSTAAHAFPEGIFYKKRFAWSDTIPHVTGAANYALMLRHMLVHEDGEDLHLLSAVPDWWLGNGQEIRLERLPTHFGVMDLIVRGSTKGVQATLVAPKRNSPKRIVLHLPASRPLLASIQAVTVVTRPDQKQRWDFPAIVEKYRSSLSPEERRKWESMGM